MRILLSIVMGASVTILALTATNPVQPNVAWSGVHPREQLREWIGPHGELNYQCLEPGHRTAIDLRPSPRSALEHARTELVLYNRWNDADPGSWERLSISAMAEGRGGHYRFGAERGGSGKFGRMIWAFEDITPGNGIEPFIILSPDDSRNIPLRDSHRVIIDPEVPQEGGSGLGVMFTIRGRPVVRTVEAGLPDSAGRGFRTLRIRN